MRNMSEQVRPVYLKAREPLQCWGAHGPVIQKHGVKGGRGAESDRIGCRGVSQQKLGNALTRSERRSPL